MPLPPLKNYPFLRLVAALAAGIVVQWYGGLAIKDILIFTAVNFTFIALFYLLPLSKKFLFGWVRGLLMLLLFFNTGMIITWQQNIQNNKHWYQKEYSAQNIVLATISEPLTEKSLSYKALAQVTGIYKNDSFTPAAGSILVYFKKNSLPPNLYYGSQIIFNKQLQSIKNSGNPAAFNYNRYCLFQNITGQVFLSGNDYKILSASNTNLLQKALFSVRTWALKILQQNIHAKRELGIAEALLIGYRNDLDKDVVQAYSNTGVVHIIAISGLHIAVIYGALLKFFSLFKTSKIKRWLEPLIILCIIWFFTMVAGAVPSVLRASVMFTFLLTGKFLQKNGNIYNTLAASAFVLLIINPFYLWDVGFQLSYAAVAGIVMFYKPVSNRLYFNNRFLRWIWQMCAVSLAAQVFTTPLIIFHFHQLPLLFLFSNIVAVPLSGIILFAELLLFTISWWQAAASFVGFITEALLRWMNDFISHINKLPFALWDGLNISVIQFVLMLAAIIFLSLWAFSKNTRLLNMALCCFLIFFIWNDVNLVHHRSQQKLIVYNVPKQNAIDFITGTQCYFAGDSGILNDALLKNFNLKPARTKYGAYTTENIMLPSIENYIIDMDTSSILLLGNSNLPQLASYKIKLTLLILSNNFNKTAQEINNLFECNYIIADSSVPPWKSAKWKKEFERLHLRFYAVTEDGAVIVNQ